MHFSYKIWKHLNKRYALKKCDKHKNLIDKFSYKLWKHLNKKYGKKDIFDFASNTYNLVTTLSNKLDAAFSAIAGLSNKQNEIEAAFLLSSASLHRLSVINYKSGKKPLNVMFLCPDKNVFCLEKLFRLMEESAEFNPVVGIFPYEHLDPKIIFDSSKYQKVVQYLEMKKMKYVSLYDFEKKEYFSLKKFQPDILFFNSTTVLKNIDVFFDSAKDAITCFVPYGYFLSNIQSFIFDYPILHQMTYLFWESVIALPLSEHYSRNNGENSFFLGYPKLDCFFDGHSQKPVWKDQSRLKKKVIWAPHHSIENCPDIYGYSSFNELADVMLELAEKYRDKIQFAFRPHPLLRPRLNADEHWGEQKTTEYYKKWEQLENGQLSDSDYTDLFLQSDAMIGDSISFMCEYSAINKPYLFTTRDDTISHKFNELGAAVFNHLLYKSPPLSEKIESFLQDVVLNGNDPLSEKRCEFTKNNLLPQNGKSASENIFDFLKRELRL